MVETLAGFGARIFIWNVLNGVLREERRQLVRIVDGVNMATPLAWKRPHVSRIGDGAQ